ncbi:MAG TPA: hypothetical protein VGM65_13595 [Candidatus Udaeobacter sp.]|jgi:hypothetical protein
MNKTLIAFLTALAVAANCCATATDDHANIKAEITKRALRAQRHLVSIRVHS